MGMGAKCIHLENFFEDILILVTTVITSNLHICIYLKEVKLSYPRTNPCAISYNGYIYITGE